MSAGGARAFDGRLKPVPAKGEDEDDDGPRLTGWTRRIEVRLAESPAMRVGSSVYCMPRLVNRAEVTRLLQQRIESSPGFESLREGPLTVRLRFWVDEFGRPTKSKLQRSGMAAVVNWIAVDLVDSMVFEPAIQDGRPIQAVVELPFRVEIRGPRRR